MPRFRVMFRCDEAVINLEDAPTEAGFFATRAVDAPTPEDAVTVALATISKDLAPRLSGNPEGLDIQVEDISQESWWWRRLTPPKGFTFFLVRPEDQE